MLDDDEKDGGQQSEGTDEYVEFENGPATVVDAHCHGWHGGYPEYHGRVDGEGGVGLDRVLEGRGWSGMVIDIAVRGEEEPAETGCADVEGDVEEGGDGLCLGRVSMSNDMT